MGIIKRWEGFLWPGRGVLCVSDGGLPICTWSGSPHKHTCACFFFKAWNDCFMKHLRCWRKIPRRRNSLENLFPFCLPFSSFHGVKCIKWTCFISPGNGPSLSIESLRRDSYAMPPSPFLSCNAPINSSCPKHDCGWSFTPFSVLYSCLRLSHTGVGVRAIFFGGFQR